MSLTASKPIVERIAVALFDRLKLLASGYLSDAYVSEVIRPTRFGGFTPKHLQIVLTQDDPEQVPELFIPGNPPAITFDQRFNIRCHAMPSELDQTPIDELLNVMTADVVKVVTDADDWHTFDGLAIDSHWDSREQISADGGVDGINVPLIVMYRTDENDPYTVRA